VSERLLRDLNAFFVEHRRCGDLDGDATDERVQWLLLDFDAFFQEHRRCGDLGWRYDRRARVAGVRRVWRVDRAAGGDTTAFVTPALGVRHGTLFVLPVGASIAPQ
jgi:hypothetical protein